MDAGFSPEGMVGRNIDLFRGLVEDLMGGSGSLYSNWRTAITDTESPIAGWKQGWRRRKGDSCGLDATFGHRHLRTPRARWRLGSVDGQSVEILGQIELAGRSYSSTLVAAVSELLVQAEIKLSQLHAMVA